MSPRTRRLLTITLCILAALGALAAGAAWFFVVPHHRGELVATVGIPLDEMRRRSSLPISAGFTYEGSTSGVFEPYFDWQVPDTSLRFRRCRFGGYGTDKSGVVDMLKVSVSPRRLSWRAMAAELAATRDQLQAGGFAPDTEGHTLRDDLLLARWLAREPPARDVLATDGFIWRRGGLEVMFLAEQQEPGRWVQTVHLSQAAR